MAHWDFEFIDVLPDISLMEPMVKTAAWPGLRIAVKSLTPVTKINDTVKVRVKKSTY